VSSDYSSHPSYEPYRYERPTSSNNNAVVGVILGALFGSFALCGFCAVGGIVAISLVGQSANRTFSSVATVAKVGPAPGPVEVSVSAQPAATTFVSHLSNGDAVAAWDMLSKQRLSSLTLTEFKDQLAGWPKEEVVVGRVRVIPGGAIGKQTFTATATDEKGSTHRLELELVSEDREWKVDRFKLK